MSEKGVEVVSPLGRIVWGHPGKPQIKKYQDGAQKGQPVIKDGQPVQQWAFGLAIPRADFETHVWPWMQQEMLTGYPNGAPGRFSWKYKDGDRDVDSNGVRYAEREGYAGHYVLTISTELAAPSIFRYDGSQYVQMDAKEIKCGDYVSVALNFKVNVATGTNTPSLYVNPRAIQFVAYGPEIVGQGGVDPQAAFGGRQFALPPGASATPTMPSGAPAMPGTAPAAPMAAPGAMPGMMPPGAPPAAPMAPAPAPAMAPPPPPAPAPVAGPQRPVDPAHVAHAGTPHEQWWNGTAWTPAPAQPAPLPPPATDFVQGAMGVPPGMPAAPGMPGMMPPR